MVVCAVCNGRFFATVSAYEQHVKTSKAHFVFRCTICNAAFPSAFARSGHLTKVHQNLLCRQCNRYYVSIDSLQQHYLDDDSHPKCHQCGRGFPDNTFLRLHQTSVHPKPVIPCATCDITFEDQADLEQHWKGSNRHPSCLVCDIGFENVANFNLHVQHIHPELWCGACGIGFASSGQLLEHYLETESSVHPTCTACGEGFVTQAVLDEHIASRHPPPPPTPPPPTPTTVQDQDEYNDTTCTVCDRVYRRQEDLLRHYKESPSHPKCLSCCEGFLDGEAYQNHVVDVHPAALTIEHHFDVAEVSPSLGAASLLTTPHRAYVALGEIPEPVEDTYDSPRTTVLGFSREADNDPETASVARRASSEPTRALPTVDIEVVTPSSKDEDGAESSTSDEDEDQDYERMDRSAYETPALETPSTPSRSERSLSYNSGPSTPERIPSPSSLISPRSPVDQDPARSPSPVPSPRGPRTPLSIRTHSVMSSASRASPGVEAMAHSYVTALPPLRSSASKQSLRSIRSPVKAASVKCFSPIARSPAPPAPPFAPRSGSQLSNVVPVSEGASPAEIRQPVPRWGSMANMQESVRAPRERRSSAPSPEFAPTPGAKPRSQASDRSSRTMNSSSQTTPAFSPAPRAESSPKPPANLMSAFAPKQMAWHCRVCLNEPSDPTVTMCGHLFCHGCIVAELAKNLQCPVCRKAMLVRLHVADN